MPTPEQQTDVLFVSEQPLWPPDQGFRVHGCQMARALSVRGLGVRMASLRPTTGCAAPWLSAMLADWPEADDADHDAFLQGWAGPLAPLRRKLAEHQAIDSRELAGLIPLVDKLRPKAVVALGQHGPAMLRGLRSAFPNVRTVWYAADEPVFFQLSCLRREGVTALRRRAYLAALYASFQKLFARGLDGAIGVSPTDTKLLKLMAGVRRAVNIPNGVDCEFFQQSRERPESCLLAFWGRLDFEPNIDAVCWFANRVWPHLRERQPQARLKIVGKNASDKVRQLGQLPGIEFVGEVEDVRPYARAASAVVLPMRCGGGIKNKLLEAASMGLPVLASAKAVKGLSWPAHARPVAVCGSPDDWVHQIERVWFDGILNQRLRRDARAWVEDRHSWDGAADILEAFLDRMANHVEVDDAAETAGTIGPETAHPRRAA